jgi:general secretion pathway protein I
MPTRSCSNRRAGFTLLEVLIAFAIVALSLAALFKAAGFGFDAVHRSGRYEEALSRAKSHLAAVGKDVDQLAGTREGDDGGGYRWELDVRPFQGATPAANGQQAAVAMLYAVRVTISWHEGRGTDEVSLRSERLGQAAR